MEIPNENFYQLTYNTSGTASAVLTKDNSISNVIVEERITNQVSDNIPIMALQNIANGLSIGNMGITSNKQDSGNEWAILTKFFSIYSDSTRLKDGRIVTHQETHYLTALAAVLHSGFDEAHIFCMSDPTARNEYGRVHESIFVLNPHLGYCNLAFRQIFGKNVPVKKSEKWLDTHYKRKTFSVFRAFETIREFTNCSTLKEVFAVSKLGKDDKMIPKILSKFGACSSAFDMDGGQQKFVPYEYLLAGSEIIPDKVEVLNERKREIYLNLLYRLQTDYEKYLVDAVNEYMGSIENDVVSTSPNVVLSGGLNHNVRANYLLLKSLDKRINLYVDPIDTDISNAIGLGYELIGSCKMEPQGLKNFYMGNPLDFENYSLNESENEKSVTPREVAELIADGNIVAIAQGRSEITDHSLGNRTILADPRTVESKVKLSNSKYQPEHLPSMATILEENVHDWFDMDRLNNSPEAMYAVDALDITKEKAVGAVYFDGSTRVQTVNPEYNQNYYNLIKEFGDLTGVPMLINTSLNMHTFPICDNMSNIMDFMRCSGVDYLYLPESGKLLFIPDNSK